MVDVLDSALNGIPAVHNISQHLGHILSLLYLRFRDLYLEFFACLTGLSIVYTA